MYQGWSRKNAAISGSTRPACFTGAMCPTPGINFSVAWGNRQARQRGQQVLSRRGGVFTTQQKDGHGQACQIGGGPGLGEQRVSPLADRPHRLGHRSASRLDAAAQLPVPSNADAMSASPSPLFEALGRQGVRKRCKRQPLRKQARSAQVLGGQLVDIPATIIRTGIGIWLICKYGQRCAWPSVWRTRPAARRLARRACRPVGCEGSGASR